MGPGQCLDLKLGDFNTSSHTLNPTGISEGSEDTPKAKVPLKMRRT